MDRCVLRALTSSPRIHLTLAACAVQMTQIGAWGLGLGTAFFSLFGIRAGKDIFLMIGLVACVVGDVMFAFFLWDQDADGMGGSNDTAATFFLMLALLSMYAIYCQFEQYREEGCGDDDEDEDEEEELAARQAAAATAAARGAGGAGKKAIEDKAAGNATVVKRK